MKVLVTKIIGQNKMFGQKIMLLVKNKIIGQK